MKKFVAFLMAFALCLACFGTYGFAAVACDDCDDASHAHEHALLAADDEIHMYEQTILAADADDGFVEYLWINRKTSTVVYSESTSTLRVTLVFDSESSEKGVEGSLIITTPYYVLGKPTVVSGSVFGVVTPEIKTTSQKPASREYSEIKFTVKPTEGYTFTQNGYVVIEYPVDRELLTFYQAMRAVYINISGNVVTTSGKSVNMDPTSSSYTAYICNHSNSNERYSVKPTCKSAGEKETYCTICNYVLKKEVVLPTDHDFDYSKAYNQSLYPYVAPTCTRTGSGCFKCKDCESILYATVPKKEHTFGSRVLQNGVYYNVCSVCNVKEVSNDQCGHDKDAYALKETITASTCTKAGKGRFQCPVCKQNEERELPLAEHKFSASSTVTTPATCTTEGKKTSVCTVCNKSVVETISALGHDLGEWQVTTESTCISNGVETRSCSRCSYKETRNTESIGHKYGSWITEKSPTCVELGLQKRICMYCGDIQTQALDTISHSYGVWSVTKPATCVETGEETRICTVCNNVDTRIIPINPENHEFGEWKTVVAKTCVTDGEKSRTCELCNKVEKEVDVATGHVFGETIKDGKISSKTCMICGYKEEAKTVKKGVEKTLSSSPATLTIVGADADKNYVFEIKSPLAQDKKLYEDYMPQKELYAFYNAYSIKTLLDGEEVAANASMTLKLETTLKDYDVVVYRIVDGQYWFVSGTERKGGQIIIPGSEIANADAIVIARSMEPAPKSIVVPIVVTVVTLVIAGGAIAFFMLKNKKKEF